MAEFVLVETRASELVGRTIWFRQMTPVGPMSTADRSERLVFETERDARGCPALWDLLSSYEIKEVDDA